MITMPEKLRILIVDDEPDIHAVTRLSLKGLKYAGRGVELATALSGKDALDDLRANPHTAVILLDVVMESESAGLDACRAIREELQNKFVRILLRTGQPGAAPERKTIEDYDIDGYLPKAELSSNRLWASVRTAMKAFTELLELERGRQVLSFLHTSVAALHAFESLDVCLQRFLNTAAAIVPTPLAVLKLETYEDKGNPSSYFLYVSRNMEPEQESKEANELAARVSSDPAAQALRTAGPFADGILVPIVLHRDLGAGWFYVRGKGFDPLAYQALPILAAHASNALYASVAQSILANREGPMFDSVTI
jgi:CheY-like chemotaxis protein